MKEHPILFNGEMVRAVLEGRKTQTRRVIKKQPFSGYLGFIRERLSHWFQAEPMSIEVKCPYGQPGDRLWVRETWAWGKKYSDDYSLTLQIIPKNPPDYTKIWYRADNEKVNRSETWKPSIYMPRWASRITLEITNVRVERVQDVSNKDAKAEGATACDFSNCDETERRLLDFPCDDNDTPYKNGFSLLWDSINEKRGFGWKVNPWVWVVEFKAIK